ncbi:MAG TPA: hypothetical protein VNA25_06220 [Phycisphaerae bacterium]|nr:hypothetical protein [Phycisphaerae bacterium]
MKGTAAIRMVLTACLIAGCLIAGCQGQDRQSVSLLSSRPPEPAGADEEGYTIRLTVFTGPHHVADSSRCKRATGELTGWKGLFVVHEQASSTLYVGHYATTGAARKDMEVIRRWTTPADLRPFQLAVIVRRAVENVGPPEWDLTSAVGDYTVVVGTFCNEPKQGIRNRKQYAVANCRDLRAKGYDAYYHHGPAQSLVTIGAFPQSSFKTVEVRPDEVTTNLNDERIKQIFKQFPYLAVNGYQEIVTATNPQTGKPEKRITCTYVTAIPRRQSVPSPSPTDRPGHTQPR